MPMSYMSVLLGLSSSRPVPSSRRAPLRVTVADAAGKGRGAFAAEDAAAGSFVGSYEGRLLSRAESVSLYAGGAKEPEYLFRLEDDLYIDAQDSEHWSRFINHAEHANLRLAVDRRRLDFFAARPIAAGEELCFDYGPEYWSAMPCDPSPDSDSRSYGRQRWLRRQRKLLAAVSPAVGTVLLPVLVPVLATLWWT